jgi:hypothetical protein
MRTRIRLALGLVVIAGLAWLTIRELYWREHPDAAFASVTGRGLPPGVRATAYRRRMDDNLFHFTHYWLLAGEPNALHNVLGGTAFERSDDDARANLPDVSALFGVPKPEVVAGYEWDTPRNRWYYIFEGEASALYAH